MVKSLMEKLLPKKKCEIALKQVVIILLAVLAAVALYYIIGGIRNAVLPK